MPNLTLVPGFFNISFKTILLAVNRQFEYELLHTIFMLNYFLMIIVLWLCRKVSLFLRNIC